MLNSLLIHRTLLFYAPVAKDYFYQGFKEFMEDGAQYFEFRTVLPGLCNEMNNPQTFQCDNATNAVETALIMKEIAEQFLQDHPNDLCGIRMIYAPPRNVEVDTVDNYLNIMFELQARLSSYAWN